MIDIIRSQPTDCLITGYVLEDTTGLDLLKAIRDRATALPVLLGTRSGSESLASEAIKAGVTDYVALAEPREEMTKELIERTERAIRSAQRTATQRDWASALSTVF